MASTAVSAQPAWSIVEDKSPTDNSPQISAGLVVGEAALILRCREQKTEAAFSTKDTYLGDKPVQVRFRINSQDPIKEAWRPSMNGLAAFAPKPKEFIRALPDSGRVFPNCRRREQRHKLRTIRCIRNQREDRARVQLVQHAR